MPADNFFEFTSDMDRILDDDCWEKINGN